MIKITKKPFSFEEDEILQQVMSELMHIPKFIRRDVAEALISNGSPRSFGNNNDYTNRLYILESATHRDSVESRAIRLLLIESLLQEMKIKSLERRINRLESERISTL